MKSANCRLFIETEPQPGRWNMAVDEALLDGVIAGAPPVMRWYQWSEPTLSLGYFQQFAEVQAHPRWQNTPVVRRLTGGGAILHDREWTYSCVIPASSTLVKHPYDLYDIIHNAIIDWFRTAAGISLSMRGVTQHHPVEPALCFLRADSHDICFDGQKVLGSAQRRRKGALLQHGSLILEQSPATPEIPGLCDLSQQRDFLTQRPALARFVAERLGLDVVAAELSDEEAASARLLERERYQTADQR